MSEQKQYRFLERRAGSNYEQLFVKGKRIRAEVLYRETIGLEPRTAEQVAHDFGVPLETVREAIDYCIENEGLLRQEREQDLAQERALGLDKPPLVPADYRPES